MYITDRASGELVCQRCGVVLETNLFDEHLEHYTDHSGPRAGFNGETLLPEQPIHINPMPGRKRSLCNVDPHATTRKLFAVVENMGFKFPKVVQDTAKMLCRDYLKLKAVRTDSRTVYAAAALYLAAKMHGQCGGRSKKEAASQFGSYGVTEKSITHTAKIMRRMLIKEPYSDQLCREMDLTGLVYRLADLIDVDEPARRAIKREARIMLDMLAEQKLEGKTPNSICSGVIWCALQTLKLQLPKQHVHAVCQVSGTTMEKMAEEVMAALHNK